MALILVDTNIIIEAVRTNCWNSLTGHHRVETVQTCCGESEAGDTLAAGYIAVPRAALTDRLRAIHDISDTDRAALLLTSAAVVGLDRGERDLFAHAHARNDDWLLCCADQAAVRAACELGWPDRLASLERLAGEAGARPSLRRHFTEAWLRGVRTRFRLDQL